jgi:hypothetical protein
MKPFFPHLQLPVFHAAIFSLVMTSSPSVAGSSWEPNPQVVQQTVEKRPSFCFEESKVPSYKLPPLLNSDPFPVERWTERRKEIRDFFETQVFGKSPGTPEDLKFMVLESHPTAMDGRATMQRVEVRCRRGEREFAFEFVLFLPNTGPGPHPVFLFLNNRRDTHTDPTRQTISEFWPAEELIGRGYGAAAFSVKQLAPDREENFRDGVIGFFEEAGPRSGDAWAALAAWAWGAQRIMDYFETRPDIAADRVGVVGHSRGGKAALWAGALDERFALVVSNGSGCGGAALSRRRFGETQSRLNEQFPHWFCTNFRAFNDREDELPVDQHMLLALIAPRALYVASADEDLWADPKGEFLSLAHASPAFELFGHRGLSPDAMPGLDRPLHGDRQAYHIRPGVHDLTSKDWNYFMDFSDKLWLRDRK